MVGRGGTLTALTQHVIRGIDAQGLDTVSSSLATHLQLGCDSRATRSSDFMASQKEKTNYKRMFLWIARNQSPDANARVPYFVDVC
mgnify:CR=1 FL=1